LAKPVLSWLSVFHSLFYLRFYSNELHLKV
jgi:hypothetical protein